MDTMLSRSAKSASIKGEQKGAEYEVREIREWVVEECAEAEILHGFQYERTQPFKGTTLAHSSTVVINGSLLLLFCYLPFPCLPKKHADPCQTPGYHL
jgi:hypothetical protein